MWQFLLRIFRGRRGARSWDATLTAPLELSSILKEDAEFEVKRRDLALRQQEAAEAHREETAEEREGGGRILEVSHWRKSS